MTGVVLGRRLLAPQVTAQETEVDAVLQQIQTHDRFFCDTMELIPAQYYFPTDEEENWLKSAPKKYHKDTMAQKQQSSAKKAVKRAKFNPSEQKTNEERQLEAAEEEKQQKQQTKPALKVQTAKDPTNVSMEGLKERLAAKLQAMREQRKADEQNGKKRKSGTAKAAEPASKKRKAASNGSAFNNKTQGKKDAVVANGSSADASTTHAKSATNGSESVDVSASGISYGSLLLDSNDNKKEKTKTRNGQGVARIKNLLKKAERNQQRIEELKKTDEGKALVQAKGWTKALKQAAGEAVLDDPKLLRKKLKKKEKQKTKSSKEWQKRTSQVEMQKKERQKKRLENLRTGGKKDKKEKKDEKAPRAGFEGKKGEKFLNADKKKQS
ncbi:hypothetical protein Poli38472_006899 [Pythium oligandrum]|uniref:Ribosomal RNA-processing protein 14/surfeit locus protein 6 C-terminal domain-containing protein n=1 Tax=Pythium oligandrum TaxID=41045 RepID=A0A8K1FF90_PYTOL|nr:hypothetical protein Poli38472_006899 [Pythium oligandrum]|eukprot:TMW58754.1 hypothetical protein Poli38472_006899 [Pythium oligandrum]